jgi:signal transduction histidine kinase
MKNVTERNFRSNAYQQMATQEKETQSSWAATPQQIAQPPQQANTAACLTEPNSKDGPKPIQNLQPMRPAQNFTAAPIVGSTDGPLEVAEGVSIPIWFGDYLRCAVKNELYVQGCWLDWIAIKKSLLADIQDLLPNADLVADPSPPSSARGERGDSGERAAYMLAAIPVRLIPGVLPIEPGPFWSPIRLSLLVAWVCVLLAAAAVAVLLIGAVSLSERRGAFVSAVTHELRTPLTTFRMYTEMLAAGMVPDEQKRQGYLNTLRVEAERLSHLVENVLAYARLERGPSQSRLQSIALKDLLEKVSPRLTERAAQGGVKLVIESGSADFLQNVKTDPSAVEQILFNLVDNACKYAVTSGSPEIRIHAGRESRYAALRICDSGNGFSDKEVRNLFKPFCKSAKEAAHSAPGVGLGLALSRRLARDMGGDLRLDRNVKPGACFVVCFPSA